MSEIIFFFFIFARVLFSSRKSVSGKAMRQTYSHIFFIGIGGIGMSALARYFKKQGQQVAGYDRTITSLTQQLTDEGIEVFYTDEHTLIPAAYKDRNNCLVVYTPAVSQRSNILQWFQNQNFEIKKRAQVLGLLTQTQQSICVGGTHGKTTISTMIGHLLYSSKVGCNAFLGGLSQNYNSNLLTNPDSPKVVIEADEFDRSFLWLSPHTAVISAIDADHLDIYGTHDRLLEAFEEFAAQIEEGGVLIYKSDLDFSPYVKDKVSIFTYNVDEGDFHAEHLNIKNGLYTFDFVTPECTIRDVTLGIPGKVNVENAIAALATAYLHGVSAEELRQGLVSFKGIRRRFQYHVCQDDLVYIDDYAHHPRELHATISSLREIYPTQHIIGIFQPHLFSRTQDFAREFAEALSLLDELWLMPIYPARETPIKGVDSELIKKNVTCPVFLLDHEQISAKVKASSVQVLLTLGAGDIDRLVPTITETLLLKAP